MYKDRFNDLIVTGADAEYAGWRWGDTKQMGGSGQLRGQFVSLRFKRPTQLIVLWTADPSLIGVQVFARVGSARGADPNDIPIPAPGAIVIAQSLDVIVRVQQGGPGIVSVMAAPNE